MSKAVKVGNSKSIHKIGVFGGSFNPPHIGHIFAVQYIKSIANFEGIIIVPCGNHAFGKDLLPFDMRFHMCKLSFFNLRQPVVEHKDFGVVQNNIVISDVENNDKISYAIDTARALKSKLDDLEEGEVELHWIVGSDCMDQIDKWKDIKELRKIVFFYEIPRQKSGLIFDMKSILPSISSTEIRKRIKEGKSVENLISFQTRVFIDKNNLYR